jgi:hypothetical protein
MRQQVGPRKLRRWSNEYGHHFIRGLHRGGSGVSLVTADHRHFWLNPMAANCKDPDVRAAALAEDDDPIHWTSCPGHVHHDPTAGWT